MSEFFEQLVIFFEDLVLAIGYPGIFAVMFTENLFPPIPTDPLLPFAGILVTEGKLDFFVVWIAAVTGAMTGTAILYAIGAWADKHVIDRVIGRYGRYIGLTTDSIDRAFRQFDRYGAWFILIGRSIPVIRSAVSLAAGMSRMSFPKFMLLSVINSTAITGFWIAAGVFLGENWEDVWDILGSRPVIVLGLFLLAVIGLIYNMRRRWRKKSQLVMAMSQEQAAAEME